MTTKAFVVLALWVVAAICFALAAFSIFDPDDFNLVAGGLLAFIIGRILNDYWTTP